MARNQARGKYYIFTYGCQMNEWDSEVMAGLVEEMGYTRAGSPEEADLILLNTCCVRESAENKVWGLLGSLGRLKQRRPWLLLGVTGCLPQRPGAAAEIKRRFPFVDLIVGTYNRHELPRLILEAERGQVVAVSPEEQEIVEGLPIRRESRLRAWVPIMFGCNNFCTYCIVPYVRGKERSRRPEDILREVKELAKEGYREIFLLGQNVNAYGKGLQPPVTFADLLRQLNAVEGIWRIRYTTSHPRDFGEDLIRAVAELPKVCENFHLPVQAGSDKILRRMGRGYTRQDYLNLVRRIREVLPQASFSTDIMVGFPGETEEDFEQTLLLVREVGFDQAFIFIYNPRPGTPAASFPDQVPHEVKVERIKRLLALQQAISRERNRAEVGKVHEVLVEGPSRTNPDRLEGRTRTYKTVILDGTPELTGKLVAVRITAGYLTHLEGKVEEVLVA
ncbi:RNA modification enzyme, MiaB family [Ammonifex degensii KC4]|uniref:tRNA-2-methylthio-N(6)-dimethylallyladenosine synthase n=1 Tax=Ammonifex degensii (strain DSM 10501 / KC4) TaxID=429009 RepID=C9RBU1_AMMDK|nr:tRNA (N6-isopentenyl adenosine(37)-C2)-methylthiotransferase MiaB [Ammonifex degensii]ACX51718.1 RNA modification enzyme, MiaB family [Ammonifex degensii KC4]